MYPSYLVGWCEPRWLARKGPPYWGAKSGVCLYIAKQALYRVTITTHLVIYIVFE